MLSSRKCAFLSKRQRLVVDYDNIERCYLLSEDEPPSWSHTICRVLVETKLPNDDWFPGETGLFIGIPGGLEAKKFVDLVRKRMERSIATPVAPNNFFNVEDDSVPTNDTLATQDVVQQL
jgi:hypothetical protein